jgi:hypothetical protein
LPFQLEESGKRVAALLFHNPALYTRLASDRAGVNITYAEENAVDPRCAEGAETHRARFERHVCGATLEPPRVSSAACHIDSFDFSMRKRVARYFAAIAPSPDNAARFVNDYASDGNLSACGGFLRERERKRHIFFGG